jgi:general secretion pathway protein G
MSRNSNRRVALARGFTLIEVLLVLAILGVIMSLVVPRLIGRQKHANADATRLSIKGIDQALKLYALDHSGEFPSSNDGLESLITAPAGRDARWRGPYLDTLPVDAWGRAFRYVYPGRHRSGGFDISSSGPDGAAGTEDDINNWESQKG